jgi:hypothetical protein
MPYRITLRSRSDATITGWYDGSDCRWSTDHKRRKLFDKKRDARPARDELRSRCPRNDKVIHIEAEQKDPSLDLGSPIMKRYGQYGPQNPPQYGAGDVK